MNCPSCQAANDEAAAACSACGAILAGPPTEMVVTVDLRTGTIFHSRYEILGLLGRGGMGMVYKARDRHLDEEVAIKILRPDFAQDPRMADRFKSEIKLARKVRHRNVCTIHDYGEERGLLFISMEFVDGVDLKKTLREKGPLPPEHALDVAIQLAEGLEAVHEAGIIHRDLKTPNVMLDGRGLARLMDFGIAKRHGEGTVTTVGSVMGTPEYMSPEQGQGGRVDYRTDLYALGIVIYEIFTGQVPFRGETPISTILKHLHEAPPLDGPVAAPIPPEMRRVLRRALAKDPAERFSSAREMAEALRRTRSPSSRQQPMSTDALLAPTVARPAVPGPGRPVRRSLPPWLVALPLVAVAGGALWAWRGRSPGPTVATTTVPSAAPAIAAPTAPPAARVQPPEPIASAGAAASPSPVASPSPAISPGLAAAPPPGSLRARAVPASPRSAVTPARAPVAAPSHPVAVAPSAALTRNVVEPAPAAVPSPAVPSRSESPAEEAKGLLQVAVIPWGEVSLDGRSLGTTPLDRITVSAGTHTLRIRHPAYQVEERRVTVRPGQVEKVLVNFPADGVRK